MDELNYFVSSVNLQLVGIKVSRVFEVKCLSYCVKLTCCKTSCNSQRWRWKHLSCNSPRWRWKHLRQKFALV